MYDISWNQNPIALHKKEMFESELCDNLYLWAKICRWPKKSLHIKTQN